MFKFFSLFISLLLSLQAYCQELSRFPIKPGSVWRINYEFSYRQNEGHISGDEEYKYFVKGDTIIQERSYFKLYKSGILYLESPLQIENKYMGAIRDSANKFFYLEKNKNTEVLLYDFDKKEGEQISDEQSGNITIDEVDTLPGGRKQFRFWLISVQCGSANTIIEGIGWMGGLLEGNSCYAHPGVRGSYLVCYSEAGICMYLSEQAIQNGIIDCPDIPTGLTGINRERIKLIARDGFLNIELPQAESQQRVEIFDNSARRMKVAKLNESYHHTLAIHELAPGSYLVRIVGKTRNWSGRFVVE